MKWAACFKRASLQRKSMELSQILRDKCSLTRQELSTHSIHSEHLSISLSRGEDWQLRNQCFYQMSAGLCGAAKRNRSVSSKVSHVVSILKSHCQPHPFACPCKFRVRFLEAYTCNPNKRRNWMKPNDNWPILLLNKWEWHYPI